MFKTTQRNAGKIIKKPNFFCNTATLSVKQERTKFQERKARVSLKMKYTQLGGGGARL